MNDMVFYCPRCQYGRCRPASATLVTIQQGLVISAPNTPAYVCDVCGYQEFEPEAVHRLRRLIGPPESGARPRSGPGDSVDPVDPAHLSSPD